MAIVILTSTKCPLCGEIFHNEGDLHLFPPMIANINDPLYLFSDAAVHSTCLEKHPLNSQARLYADKLLEASAPANRTCDITGEPITNVNNYLSFGLLTTNTNEPLHQFNFLKMAKSSLPQWPDRFIFIEAATAYLKEGKWKDYWGTKILQDLINEVSQRP